MKDIIIKGTRIKRELIFWLISFLAAVGINIFGIIKYNTNWWELFSQLHIVIILSIMIFFVIALIRGLVFWMQKVINKK